MAQKKCPNYSPVLKMAENKYSRHLKPNKQIKTDFNWGQQKCCIWKDDFGPFLQTKKSESFFFINQETLTWPCIQFMLITNSSQYIF